MHCVADDSCCVTPQRPLSRNQQAYVPSSTVPRQPIQWHPRVHRHSCPKVPQDTHVHVTVPVQRLFLLLTLHLNNQELGQILSLSVSYLIWLDCKYPQLHLPSSSSPPSGACLLLLLRHHALMFLIADSVTTSQISPPDSIFISTPTIGGSASLYNHLLIQKPA